MLAITQKNLGKSLIWFQHSFSLLHTISLSSTTFLLLVLLSCFNGVETFLQTLLYEYNPEIKICVQNNKKFNCSQNLIKSLQEQLPFSEIIEVYEQEALVANGQRQIITKLKGVSQNYLYTNRFQKALLKKNVKLWYNNKFTAILNKKSYHLLRPNLEDPFTSLDIFYPEKNLFSFFTPCNLAIHPIIPIDVYLANLSSSNCCLIVPIEFVQKLTNQMDYRTALEIQFKNKQKTNTVKKQLQKILPNYFQILDFKGQNSKLIESLRLEKKLLWLTCLTFLILASLNVIFSLCLFFFLKKENLQILSYLGMSLKQLRFFFFLRNLYTIFYSLVIGNLLFFIFFILHRKIGIIPFTIQTSSIRYYPINLNFYDITYAILYIIVINNLISLYPLLNLKKWIELK